MARFGLFRISGVMLLSAFAAFAQSAEEKQLVQPPEPSANAEYIVEPGSKIPLSLINSVST